MGLMAKNAFGKGHGIPDLQSPLISDQNRRQIGRLSRRCLAGRFAMRCFKLECSRIPPILLD
jgi:hypothetical protein